MGKNSRIFIRAISEDDVRMLVPLHSEIFKEYNGTMMGTGYLESLYHTLACEPACISIVAVEDSKILGWVGGVGEWTRFQRALVRQSILRAPVIFFSIFKNRPRLFARIFSVLWRLFAEFVRPPKERKARRERGAVCRAASLLVIGVVPGHQKQGLGQFMMGDFHQRLLSRGFTRSTLNTFSDNDAGNRAFQKAGYRLSGTNAGINYYEKCLTKKGRKLA